jgi:hypothetical protein
MKTLTVHLDHDQLSRIIAEAQQGDVIVLTDGERRLTLQAGHSDGGELDMEQGRPELAAELLLAGKRRVTAYSREDLEAVAEQIRREKDTKERLKAES